MGTFWGHLHPGGGGMRWGLLGPQWGDAPSGDTLTRDGGHHGATLLWSGATVGPGPPPWRRSLWLTRHLLSPSPKPINRGATGATPPPDTGVPPTSLHCGGGGEEAPAGKLPKSPKPRKEMNRPTTRPPDKYLKTLSSLLLLLNQAPGEEAAAAGGVLARDGPPPGHRGSHHRAQIFIRIIIAVFCFFF